MISIKVYGFYDILINTGRTRVMLFHSYLFIFVFFPVTLFLWYWLNRIGKHRFAQILLAVLSLVFYGYGHVSYIVLILVSVLVNWLTSSLIEWLDERGEEKRRAGTVVGIAGICFNIGLLFYFKYFDFFLTNINRLFSMDFPMKKIALPLGISFFTFQQISFVADRIMRKTEHYRMLDYINYVTFFPQLVAGPIVNHRDLVPQFQAIGTGDRKVGGGSGEHILTGIRLFVLGMAKKVLLADKFGILADAGYLDVASLDAPAAFLVMLCYTFQIYFDFSGYCDMALGIAKLFRIDLPRNFDAPYRSCSVKEFWNRWHMTLNAFFTQYVYIPLGGSRRGLLRKLRNTMVVFLLSGIWHGAAWTFVLWGILHGLMLCLENFSWVEKIPRKLRWFFTFTFINLAWVLFRSNSIPAAFMFYQKLFSFTNKGKIFELCSSIESSWNYPLGILAGKIGGNAAMLPFYCGIVLLLLLLAVMLCRGRETYVYVAEKEATAGKMFLLALLFTCSVVSLSGVTSFLYFNF